jgi:uncharacterized SAM-binding protein YcdF (DUF218 family)
LKRLLQPLWDYLAVSEDPRPADLIFVFGSADYAVPTRAAEIYHQGYAPLALVSGSFGRLTEEVFDQPEADVFKSVLLAAGVPETAIVTEPEATNTLENVQFGMVALANHRVWPQTALLVAKGFVMRRCVATFARQYPDVQVWPCPPLGHFSLGLDRSVPDFAARLVAELDRLERYAATGDIVKQEIPETVRVAAKSVAAALVEA